MLDKTYSWQSYVGQTPYYLLSEIPGIGYVGQNLFLAEFMLDKHPIIYCRKFQA